MKATILVLAFAIVASLAWAGGKASHPVTVTYTLESGQTWSDSGDLVSMEIRPSPVPGYSLSIFNFTDHADVFHLDDGNVGLTFTK